MKKINLRLINYLIYYRTLSNLNTLIVDEEHKQNKEIDQNLDDKIEEKLTNPQEEKNVDGTDQYIQSVENTENLAIKQMKPPKMLKNSYTTLRRTKKLIAKQLGYANS